MLPPRTGMLALLTIASYTAGSASQAAEFDTTYGKVYVQRESGPLEADLYVPRGEGPFPGVLVVHGGAWHLGTRAQLSGFAQMLASHGFTAVAISYRLAPKHLFPAQIEDCKAAVRWMRCHARPLKLDPEHLGAYGYSAGGQLVALLATTDADDGLEGEEDADAASDELSADSTRPISTRLQAVVAGGAPCDFRLLPLDNGKLAFWLGGTRRERAEQYRLASPSTFVTADDPPMLLFHGEKDALVPLASPMAMRQALAKVGVPAELHLIERTGHIMAATDKEAARRSLQFFVNHLGTPP